MNGDCRHVALAAMCEKAMAMGMEDGLAVVMGELLPTESGEQTSVWSPMVHRIGNSPTFDPAKRLALWVEAVARKNDSTLVGCIPVETGRLWLWVNFFCEDPAQEEAVWQTGRQAVEQALLFAQTPENLRCAPNQSPLQVYGCITLGIVALAIFFLTVRYLPDILVGLAHTGPVSVALAATHNLLGVVVAVFVLAVMLRRLSSGFLD